MKNTRYFLAILGTLSLATVTSAKADPHHHHGAQRVVGAVLGALLAPAPVVVQQPMMHRPGCPCPACARHRYAPPPPPRGPFGPRGGYGGGPRFEGGPQQVSPQMPQQGGGQQRPQQGGHQSGGQKPSQQGGGQKPQQGGGQQRPNR